MTISSVINPEDRFRLGSFTAEVQYREGWTDIQAGDVKALRINGLADILPVLGEQDVALLLEALDVLHANNVGSTPLDLNEIPATVQYSRLAIGRAIEARDIYAVYLIGQNGVKVDIYSSLFREELDQIAIIATGWVADGVQPVFEEEDVEPAVKIGIIKRIENFILHVFGIN